MIVPVNEENLKAASAVYMLSWRSSHKDICSAEFVQKHDEEYMKAFFSEKIKKGYKIFLCLHGQDPVGTVGISPDDELCLLYVLPEEQGKGFGSELLNYALSLCKNPWLTVLETNRKAIKFYEKRGFSRFDETNENKSSKKGISEYKYVYRSENI